MKKRNKKNKHIYKQNPLSNKYQNKPTDKLNNYSFLLPTDKFKTSSILAPNDDSEIKPVIKAHKK